MEALDTKKKMMNMIDFGTTHLSLLMSIGKSISELDVTAKVVVSIVGEIYRVSTNHCASDDNSVLQQRIEKIPKAYMSLRDTVLDLVDELRSAQEAGRHYDSQIAGQALDELIELVIQASMKISTCFSRPKLGKSAFMMLESHADSLKSFLRRSGGPQAMTMQANLVESCKNTKRKFSEPFLRKSRTL